MWQTVAKSQIMAVNFAVSSEEWVGSANPRPTRPNHALQRKNGPNWSNPERATVCQMTHWLPFNPAKAVRARIGLVAKARA